MSETAYGPTAAGSVVLDVGGQVGALVLYTAAALAGAEIEISPQAPGARRTHACVRERPSDHGTLYAAVYQGLTEDDYTVWAGAGIPLANVRVIGGQITEYRLPGTAG